MISEQYILVACALSSISSLNYAYLTYVGRVKPKQISWLLWSVAPIITCAAQASQSLDLQSLFSLCIGISPLLVLIAGRIKHNYFGGINKLDALCIFVFITGIIGWIVSNRSETAIFFSIVSGTMASIPTILKAYLQPHTEAAMPYVLGLLSAVIILLAIDNWRFSTYGFATYLCISNGLTIIMLLKAAVLQSYRPIA